VFVVDGQSWEACQVTDSSSAQTHSVPSADTAAGTTTWLAIPDLVEVLGISQSRVRQLIEDKHLLAVRRDGRLSVPSSFIREGSPVGELRGTLIVLSDDGFTDEQAMEWLLEVDDSLGVPPIDALLAGRKAEVRRVAQALA
jgi:hypothetical protein